MKRKTILTKHKQNQGRFDLDCVIARRHVRQLLRKYRKTLIVRDREHFCNNQERIKTCFTETKYF